jgi:radical SAM superfamily enzyme YgiQ (UPF0313 family)
MKILITTLNSKFIHSSLSVRYLKRVSENIDQIKVDMKEFTINMHIEDIVNEIYRGKYNLVAFSTYIWNYRETKEICRNLKKIIPGIKILLGGPEVSYKPEVEMKKLKDIDYIISGEGEETFKEFLIELANDESTFINVKGLTFRENGKIIVNEFRELIKDLDTIPFPYDGDLKGLDNRIIYYESTRGCPFNCSYCLSSTIKGVRYFSIERVKKDLKFFLKKQVKQVKFVDRTFNIKKEHYFEIIKFLNENDNGITNFHFEITASLLDDEVIDYIGKVRDGLFQLEIGVQTTNEETLIGINRNMKFLSIQSMLEKAVNLKNIHVHLDLIAGLPYEGYDRFLKSFDDVYNLYPNKLQLGFLKILKGSKMEKEISKYGIVYDEEPPYEVYYNNYLNYDEMIKIKGIEKLLDIYYNSHFFENSLKYIIKKQFKNNSKFYEKFYEYWDKNNLFNFKYSKLQEYQILIDFNNTLTNENEIFLEILKFDYIVNKNKKIDELFNRIKPNNFRNQCHKFLQSDDNVKIYLSEFLNMNAKKIIKKVHFEIFKFDILNYIKADFSEISDEEIIVLFDYSKEILLERSRYYKVKFREEK